MPPSAEIRSTDLLHRLRRRLLEHLQRRAAAQGLRLPPYQQRVAIVRALINVHEDVQWDAQVVGPVQWNAHAAPHEPVALARLDTGVALQLFVVVGNEALPPPRPDGAQAVFRCHPPSAQALLDRHSAPQQHVEQHLEQHLEQHGELVWVHHPDTHGRLAAAQARLDARSRQIYSNWLAMASEAGGPATVDDADESRPAPLFYAPVSPAVPERLRRHACAPGHAPHVSFTFYRVSASEAWLLYLLEREGPLDWRTTSQKHYALAPYPDRFEGWADALPSAVGVADKAAGIVRCKGFLDAVTYLSRRSRITRSSRDPDAFRGL